MRRTINIWWLIGVMACILIAFFTYSSRLSETIADLQAVIEDSSVRLSKLQAENAELQAKLKSAGTDAFIEDQARNVYGYMTPDEIRFVIESPEESDGAEEVEEEAEIPSP